MSVELKPKDSSEFLVDLQLDDEPIDTNTALLQIDNNVNTRILINASNPEISQQFSSSEEDLFYVRRVRNDDGGFLRGVIAWDSAVCVRMAMFTFCVFGIIAVLMYKSYKAKTNISGGSPSSSWSFSLNAWSPVDATYSSKWSKSG